MSTILFRGSRVRWASALGDNAIALIAGALAMAAFLCLAAIDPATWTFESNVASHIRSELARCLTIPDSVPRLGCYDEVARQPPPQPAKGANALPWAFGQHRR